MTKTQKLVTAATLIVGLGMGCDRSPAEEQERAAEAQQEANEKIGEARQEAAQEIREANQERAEELNDRPVVVGDNDGVNDGVVDRDHDGVADRREGMIDRNGDGIADREPVRGTEPQDEYRQKNAEAKKDLAEDKAEAQQEANETIADAKEQIAEDRRELIEWGNNELAELDKAISELTTEAREAEPPVQQRVDRSLQQLRNQRAALMNDVASIDTKPAAQLERFKKQLESKFEKMDDRVETLRDSMK
jgi:hypothetical protein